MEQRRTEHKEGEPRQTTIITHRGLDPEKQNYFAESSREAFADHIARGFGLEFDLQFTRDGHIVILHDDNLTRLTGGNDSRKIHEVDCAELLAMDFKGCHLASLGELIRMIQSNAQNRSVNAIHIKHAWQGHKHLKAILKRLEGADAERFVLFDLKVPAARYLKEKNRHLHLAPSVAHEYDRERYNSVVGGTLLPLEAVIRYRSVYDWVWLDEWDRSEKRGGIKALYNTEVFASLRKEGLRIALVTPELHKTSPGLLGGEAHEDASTKTRLMERIAEILMLHPDAVCTDYPDDVRRLLLST